MGSVARRSKAGPLLPRSSLSPRPRSLSDFAAFGPPWLFPLPLSLSAEAGDTSAAHRMDKKATETLRMGHFSCDAPPGDASGIVAAGLASGRADGERACRGYQANARGGRQFPFRPIWPAPQRRAGADVVTSDATVEASGSKGHKMKIRFLALGLLATTASV